jgi:hypothetical protein
MNVEIKKQDWTDFFEAVSMRRYKWITKIEVLNPEIGDQTLTEGLPLNGMTAETKGDQISIDLSVGENTRVHQTHRIKNPLRVVFLAAPHKEGDVIDIEEADGTKTLITFIEPMGIIVGFGEAEVAAAAF